VHGTETTTYQEGSEIGSIPNNVPYDPSYTFNFFTLSGDPSFVASSTWIPGPSFGDLIFQANWSPNNGGGFGGGGFCSVVDPWGNCLD
jgi:hypothetical protein